MSNNKESGGEKAARSTVTPHVGAVSLREAKRHLVGVRVSCAMGLAGGSPDPDLRGVYEILNVTRDALVVAPVINMAPPYGPERFGPRLDRKTSVLISTGVARHKYTSDVVLFLHPEHLARLHGLLGIDPSAA